MMVNLKHALEQVKLLFKRLHEHNTVTYGDYVQIGDFTYGNPTIKNWGEKVNVRIGKYCSFADGVQILAGGEHRLDWVTTYPFNTSLPIFDFIEGHPSAKGDIDIGNDVFVGSNTIILSGVTIGDGSVIGAGAIVTKDVPPYSIVVGNPAKVIKFRFDKKTIESLMKIKWWEWEVEKVLENVELLQSDNIQEFINKNLTSSEN